MEKTLPEKERYCRAFLEKYPACALECRYYRECMTWENYVKSMDEKREEKIEKHRKKKQKPSGGLDAFLL